MVQIIPRSDFGSHLGKALGSGFEEGLNVGLERQYAQAQKKEEQSRLKAALGDAEKIYNDQSKSIAQKRIGLAQALQNYPEHAKQLTHPLNELELQETKNKGKPPAGGHLAQPVDPAMIGKIEQFVKSNPTADSNTLAVGLAKLGVPPDIASPYVENARRATENLTKQTNVENKNAIQIHKLSEDYANKIRKEAESAKNIKTAVKTARQALKNHKTGSLTFENFTKKQLKGTPFENLGLTKEGAIIEATVPAFLEGFKDIVGVRLSDADLGVILGKSIDLGKDNAANEAILDYNEKLADYKIDKEKIAAEISKKNKGLRGIDFQNEVNEEFDKRYGNKIDKDFVYTFLGDKIPMKFPDGKVRIISKSQYEEAVKDQAVRQ